MCRKRDVDGLLRATAYQSKDSLRQLKVRQEALEALGTLRDRAAVLPLIAIIENTAADSPRIAAARALGMIGDARAVGPLSVVLREVKEHCGSGLSQALDRQLHAYLRQAVIDALGRIEDARTIEPLIGALSDPDPSTREEALSRLAEKRDPRAVKPLGAALHSATWLLRQSAILEALRSIGGAVAERILQEWQRQQQEFTEKAEEHERLRRSMQEEEQRRQTETEERVRRLRPEIDRMTRELIEIGRRGGFLAMGPGGSGGGQSKARARVIGERLDEIGGIELMRSVGQRVARELGPGSGAGRELEAAWDGIGSWHG